MVRMVKNLLISRSRKNNVQYKTMYNSTIRGSKQEQIQRP